MRLIFLLSSLCQAQAGAAEPMTIGWPVIIVLVVGGSFFSLLYFIFVTVGRRNRRETEKMLENEQNQKKS